MARDLTAEFEASLVGGYLSVTRGEEGHWTFSATDGALISVSGPWRVVADGRIALARDDDGQRFGQAEAVDAEAVGRYLFTSRKVWQVRVDRQTGDLTLFFDPDRRLEIFNNSATYEGWRASYGSERSKHVVATGGGQLSFWKGS